MKKIIAIIFSIFLVVLILVSLYGYSDYKNCLKYHSIVSKCSTKYNLDSLLIYSVMKAESNFNSNAISKKGAIGLMQIMPSTAKELADNLKYENFIVDNLYEPEININIGCSYLQYLLGVFNNDINLALSAYNAGIGNVLKWNKDSKIYDEDKVLFKETKKYIQKVNRFYRILKQIKNLRNNIRS